MSDEDQFDQFVHGLDALIEQGRRIRVQSIRPSSRPSSGLAFADHEQFTVWRMTSLAFINGQLPAGSPLSAQVMEKFSAGGHRTASALMEMISYLDGLKRSRLEGLLQTAAEESAAKADATSGAATRGGRAILRQLCGRFHAVARQLRQRHDGRETLDVSDEYDAQDLMHALLTVDFEDVRPEDPCPAAAGASSRIDFYLPSIRTLLELKHTREGLTTKKLGEDLAIDIERYRSRSDCDLLVCFVYDPAGRVSNPAELEKSLSGDKGAGRMVEVVIRPRH